MVIYYLNMFANLQILKGEIRVRIAAFVLGLIFSLVVLFGSFIAACSSGLGMAVGEAEAAESLSIAAGGALFLAILGIIGSALAFRHPKASGALLIIAAFFLILIGATTIYKDMGVYGAVIGLAGIFAFIGSRRL